jgi:anti-sigma regulatory factor (Ser/Thr protein kinase)
MTESQRSASTSSERRLEIGNETPELRRLSVWLRGLLGDEFPEDTVLALDLGLQEAVANTTNYAFPDLGAHTIVVTLRRLEDRIEIEIEDDGIPFDPLAVPLPPLPERLEDLVPGGNGIRLMRHFLDGISYRRSSGRNHLTLTRRLKPASRP